MEKKKMYGSKIRTIRLLRGYSQEHMAEKMGIDQSAYSRIENNNQKLTVQQLETIAKELGVSIQDITNHEPVIINNNSSTIGAQGHIENFYNDQKDMLEKIIASKDDEIKNLKEVIQSLKEVITSIKK